MARVDITPPSAYADETTPERNREMPEPVTILHLTQPGPNGGPIHLLASEIAGVLTERSLLRGSKDVTAAILMKGNDEPVRVAESVEHVTDLWTRSIEGAWSAP